MNPDARVHGSRGRSDHGSLDALLVTGPFHAALRAAIRERGLSLERLRSHLARRGIHVGVSSLSFWQHGHTLPTRRESVQAVRALDEILQLPSGSLLRLLAEAQARCGVVATAGQVGPIDEMYDAVRHDVDVVGLHERLLISAERRLGNLWIRTALRARIDGVDRFFMYFQGDGDTGPLDDVVLNPVANCRLGPVHRHPTAPVLLVEMLFDETLRAGQTWVFDVEMGNGGEPCDALEHDFDRPVGQYVGEVHFDPAALPVDCYTSARSDLHGKRRRMETLTLNRYHSVHFMASNVTAGVLGVAWTWADAGADPGDAESQPHAYGD